jgi:hypothetical protein
MQARRYTGAGIKIMAAGASDEKSIKQPQQQITHPDQVTTQVMPANVRAGQVIGLVEVTGGLGSPIDASRLADEFGGDIATFLPIIDTAELLGLVRAEKGDVFLTDFGLRFQKVAKNKVSTLKDQLAKLEPFSTALALVSTKKKVSSHDIAEVLSDRGIRWHHTPEINEALIQNMLIHWAIYAGLLAYNGKSGKFHKP